MHLPVRRLQTQRAASRPLTVARLHGGRDPRPAHRRAGDTVPVDMVCISNLLWVGPHAPGSAITRAGRISRPSRRRGPAVTGRGDSAAWRTRRPSRGVRGSGHGCPRRPSLPARTRCARSLALITFRAVTRRAALDVLERLCHPSRQAEPSVRKVTPERALFLADPRKGSWYNNAEGSQHGLGRHA